MRFIIRGLVRWYNGKTTGIEEERGGQGGGGDTRLNQTGLADVDWLNQQNKKQASKGKEGKKSEQ